MKLHNFVYSNRVCMLKRLEDTNNLLYAPLFIGLLTISTHARGTEIELITSPSEISKQPTEQDKKIKLPEKEKPITVKAFKDYKKIVDCDIIIDAGSDLGGIEANKLLGSLKICKGRPDQDGKTYYNPFVVIASMPAAYFVFNEWTEIANRGTKTIEIEKNINDPLESNGIEAYQSPKGTFAVFIPKGYDKAWLNNNLKELTAKDIQSYSKIKKTTSKLQKIKHGPYKLSDEAQKVDIADLASIFSKELADTALCVRLSGHGHYNVSIADMHKDTYFEFLELLNKLNTQFLFVSSCFAGGRNALIMHGALEKSLIGLPEKKYQKKDFNIEDIQFPIVVDATTDEMSTAEFYRSVRGTEQEYALNIFFGLLHGYLQSPTWDVGMTRKEWHEKHGEGPLILMKDVLKPLFLVQPLIQNLPSIFVPDHLVKGTAFFEAIKVDDMAIITNKFIEKPSENKIEIGKTNGNNKQLKESKYVLIYPIDMSKINLEVLGTTPPAFISKLGGDAYHIIGTLSATKCKTKDIIIKSFLYTPVDNINRAMGVSNKAWFIKKMKMSDDVWSNAVIYKPHKAVTSTSGESTYCSLVVYQSNKDKKWYAMQVNIWTNTKELQQVLEEPFEISEAYYTSLLGEIKDRCTPNPVAVLRFTGEKENIASAQKAFEEFAASAVEFPVKCYPKDEIERVQKVYMVGNKPNIKIMAVDKLFDALQKQSENLDKKLFDTMDEIKTTLKKESQEITI